MFNSLDVRVIGVAGGSMVRLRDRHVFDVGPRSAHIAGLPYAAFADPERMGAPSVGNVPPASRRSRRLRGGTRDRRHPIRHHHDLRGERARLRQAGPARAWQPRGGATRAGGVGHCLGRTVDETARTILQCATDKVIPVVELLIAEYALDRDQAVLVGEGGGAAALIPFAAERLGISYQISPDAEVISSIGVALALVRESIERVIPNPTPDALLALRREAFDAAVALGASPDEVEVTIEVDAQTQRVRATAMGASEMRAKSGRPEVGAEEARAIAARSMDLPAEGLSLAAETPRMRVFQGSIEQRSWRLFRSRRTPVRAVDAEGVIRVQRGDAAVRQADARGAAPALRQFWTDMTIYNGDSVMPPDMFVIVGARVVDLTGIASLDQALAIAHGEFEGLAATAPVAMIATSGSRRG